MIPKNAFLALVEWKDPSTHTAVTDIFQAQLANQKNVGFVVRKGGNLFVINAVTRVKNATSDAEEVEYDITIIPKLLVLNIKKLE